MKTGFIGLGNLGTPIAENLLEANHHLHVYNRTKSKTAPLAAKGAVVCDSIAELAQKCDVVFSIVSDDTAVKSISEGEGGLISNMKPGSIHLSMSTILPQTAKEMEQLYHQRGLSYLATPVFGRPEAASARRLHVVFSGDGMLRKRAERLLREAGAASVWDFGENIEAANTIKLCGNFLIASVIEAIGESTALANKSGVDGLMMWNFFLQTLFNTPVFHNYSQIIIQKKFEPASFTAQLGLKDMNLVLKQAASVDLFMPLASLLKENLQQLVSQGKDQVDWSAVSQVAETTAQV